MMFSNKAGIPRAASKIKQLAKSEVETFPGAKPAFAAVTRTV